MGEKGNGQQWGGGKLFITARDLVWMCGIRSALMELGESTSPTKRSLPFGLYRPRLTTTGFHIWRRGLHIMPVPTLACPCSSSIGSPFHPQEDASWIPFESFLSVAQPPPAESDQQEW